MRSWWILGLGAVVLAVPAFSHPGRTNSAGCHVCRTNCDKWGEAYGVSHCHGGGSSSSSRDRSADRSRSGGSSIPRLKPPSRKPSLDEGVLEAEVLLVVDGDTFLVESGDDTRLLSLYGIDAPEPEQPSGGDARRAFRKLAEGQRLRIELKERDRERRRWTASLTTVSGEDVAAQLLEDGWAWAAPGAPASYRRSMETARSDGIGLWAEDDPEPPWQYRRRSED